MASRLWMTGDGDGGNDVLTLAVSWEHPRPLFFSVELLAV